MPSAIDPNPRAASAAPVDVDNLFNYDDAVEDFLKDLPLDKENTNNTTTAAQEPMKDIDEEITVKKKRKPNPKLDEARLLSDAGIPRLRKITKSRLKFRGKGHEFSDISRLLNTYQLWLDDLFPRFKFKDALTDVEKVGHSKRMQVTRRAWLDATKPRQKDASPESEDDVAMSGALPVTGSGEDHANDPDSDNEQIFGKSLSNTGVLHDDTRNNEASDAPDDDELDALLAEISNDGPVTNVALKPGRKGPFEEDVSNEDDLDALLAREPSMGTSAIEAGSRQSVNGAKRVQTSLDDEFGDEEEAMASMGMW